jgi:hypothetical protein
VGEEESRGKGSGVAGRGGVGWGGMAGAAKPYGCVQPITSLLLRAHPPRPCPFAHPLAELVEVSFALPPPHRCPPTPTFGNPNPILPPFPPRAYPLAELVEIGCSVSPN